MSNQKVSFASEVKAFSYLFAGLVSLCTLPVLAYHYWQTLTGFALLAIGGLALTDCVLWFASHWSTKTRSGVMKAVSLTVKFSIAGTMIAIAALAILLMRSERQVENMAKQSSEARIAEIKARTEAAKELAQVQGGRSAAREIAKTGEGESVTQIAQANRSNLEERIPGWLLDWGMYVIPPLCAIVGALVLSIAAMIVRRREEEAEMGQEIERPWSKQSHSSAPSPSLPAQAPAYGQDKPRVVWQGGKQIEQARPS